MRTIKTLLAAAAIATVPLASHAITVVTNLDDAPAVNNLSDMPFVFGGFTERGEQGGSYSYNFFNDLDTPVLFGTTAFAGPNITDGITLTFSDGTVLDLGSNSESSAEIRFDQGEAFSLALDYSETGSDPLGRFGFAINVAAVPLPAGALLLTTALGGGMAVARRRKSKANKA